MNNELMFTSSKTDLWAYHPEAFFFDKLHKVFRFEVDGCALPENAKQTTARTTTDWLRGMARDMLDESVYGGDCRL